MNLQITQTAQPTFTVEVVQNLVPVISAQVVIGSNSGGTANIEFGDTMTGTGTPADPVNVSNDILDQINYNTQTAQDNASQIEEIQDLIPATANQNNPLVDQGFVNSSIQTATAYFRGDWATWADVPTDPAQYPADATGNRTPIANDYMVVITDEQENGGTWRYKYTGVWSEQGKDGWLPEYQVNETPLTAAQLAALNSGVTAQAVSDIAANKTAVAGKQDKLNAGTGIKIEGNTISTSGGDDYLPLSGGTLTGKINFSVPFSSPVILSVNGTDIIKAALGSTGTAYGSLYFSKDIMPFSNKGGNVGSTVFRWNGVFATKLNNGADIAIPTDGGTMARIEDIDAAVGDISAALTAILGE